MTDFCCLLEPKQERIEGKDPQVHICLLKDSNGDNDCIASDYYGVGEDKFVEYNPNLAQECPAFTLDSVEAETLKEMYEKAFKR